MIGDLFCEKCLIDGEWRTSSKSVEVVNPSTGDVFGRVAKMDKSDVANAVDAAATAFVEWSKMSGRDRGVLLDKWHKLVIEKLDQLSQIITCEMGKPLAESKAETLYGASFIEFYAEEAKRVYGEIISDRADRRLMVTKQPVGVVGCITPWNFPMCMVTRKISPALAAGCTVVLKPSELTPFSALALAKLAVDAGVPKGVINVVVGDAAEIGDTLMGDKRIRKFSFTGSTVVGRELLRRGAETVKKMSMELGGNAPFVVFDDANIDQAVKHLMMSKFRNAGQACVSANRVFVHRVVYETFAEKLAVATKQLVVGDGLKSDTTIGPMINTKAVEKCERLLADALENGAKIICGGEGRNVCTGNGTFFDPTVLVGVTDDMAVAREEIFGPVVPLLCFETDEEVIRRANDTEYGLAAYFCTENISRAWKVAEALDCGIVTVNAGVFTTEVAPFGGMKQSGLGREGSKHGLDEFLEMKYICFGGV